MYAVVIGIDNYVVQSRLKGAVKDAKHVKEFLQTELEVPQENITELFDDKASRDNIISAVMALYSPNSRVKRDDLIIIYFAGHSARGEAPSCWCPGAKDRTVEMICPVDTGSEKNGKVVSGIPEVVISNLIARIADEKSDNIVKKSSYIGHC